MELFSGKTVCTNKYKSVQINTNQCTSLYKSIKGEGLKKVAATAATYNILYTIV